ncbi:hypothetical protein U8C40_36290 (plasmid) [Sinorhizobium medicae]|nr:hypothetical protein U8C40_36290 [Sinorhizobium medicae]
MKTIRHRLSSIIEYGRCALKRDEEKRVRFSARIPLYLIESSTFMFLGRSNPKTS